MEEGLYLTIAWDPEWEQDALRIVSSLQEIDPLVRAAERLAQRFMAKEISIPTIPGTEVRVFRLDPGCNLPATLWYFRIERSKEVKAVFIALETIEPDDDADDDIELVFDE